MLHFTGATNVLTTTPFWVVNTRLKLQGVRTENKKYDNERHSIPYKGITGNVQRFITMPIFNSAPTGK